MPFYEFTAGELTEDQAQSLNAMAEMLSVLFSSQAADGQAVSLSIDPNTGLSISSDLPGVSIVQVATGSCPTGSSECNAFTVQWDQGSAEWLPRINPITLLEANGNALVASRRYVGIEQGWDYTNVQPLYATSGFRGITDVVCTGGGWAKTWSG